MSNLSDLPHDLLVAAKDECFEGLRLRQRTPYLMLPVRDDGNDDDVRELYSLVEGESIVASVKVPKFNTRKCFESLGWLLAVEKDGTMSLLNPFSGTEIPLPHQKNTFPIYRSVVINEYIFIQKMVLSSRPNEGSDFVLMVIVGGARDLAYWRLGDKAWNIIKGKQYFLDVVYHGNGIFYAITNVQHVWVFNFAGNDNNNPKGRMMINCRRIVPYLKSMHPHHIVQNYYILKSVDDALLLVTRMSPYLGEGTWFDNYITSKFRVFEVDTAMMSWKEIYSLGRMAIFLGNNSTIAVDASGFSGGGIKANCIYFTDDEFEFHLFQPSKGPGKDIGVYNFETDTVEPIYPGEPLCNRVSTSLWINPCF